MIRFSETLPPAKPFANHFPTALCLREVQIWSPLNMPTKVNHMLERPVGSMPPPQPLGDWPQKLSMGLEPLQLISNRGEGMVLLSQC
jgi:hypothetical protein